MRTGGWADKLGNRYEGRWTAKQLLFLLAGRLQFVQLESEDALEHRVDLLVGRHDGVREAHQCKKNNSAKNWSITELAKREVLPGIHRFLTADAGHRFSFVSNREATDLKRLIEKARESPGDFDAFRERLDKHDRASWQTLCREMQLAADADAAFRLLARVDIVVFDDGAAGQDEVESRAELLLDGNPRSAVLRLADFALERMGRPIYADDLRRFLNEHTEFRVRDLAYSPQIAAVIEARQTEFRESIRRLLIQGELLPRPETVQLYAAILKADGPRIHCVHGGGGQGKSCILHELAQLLVAEGVSSLPLRFDVCPPRGNTRAYGQLLELPESPVKCLHAVAGDRVSVLLIDQLDALRWSPQHDPSAWVVFERLVNEALQVSGSMHVVVACRTFDLDHDPQIRPWREQEKIRELLHRVPVGDLPEAYVRKVVEKTAGSWDMLTARQRRLLERPQSLYLWTNLPDDARTAFRTSTDLMRAFWSDARARLVGMGVASADTESALGALVSRLDEDGASTAPAMILDRWQTARNALVSLRVIEEVQGRRLRFAHQGYFDYYLAEMWLARLRQQGASITGWLSAMDDQSLLRRGQLRQLLAVLRDDDPARFRNAARELLLSSSVRFHLQHLTLQFLGSIPDPTPTEVTCVVAFLQNDKLRLVVAAQVLYGHAQWFDAFDAQHMWLRWIESDEPWQVNVAATMLYTIASERGDRVAQLILPHIDKPAPWPERLRSVMPWNADQDTRLLFEARLRLLARGVLGNSNYWFTEKLAAREPTWLIDLLACKLLNPNQRRGDDESDTDADERSSPYWIQHHAAATVRKIAEEAPAYFWKTLAPLVVSAASDHRKEPSYWERAPFEHDALWQDDPWRYRQLGREGLPNFLAVAGGRWGHEDPAALLSAIAPIADSAFLTIEQLVGSVWLLAPDAVADDAVSWLIGDNRRFCLGHLGTGRGWRLARDLVRRFAPLCSGDVYQRLEKALMAGDPAGEVEQFKETLKARFFGRSRIGFLRHALLPALPESRRSPPVTNAIGQLQAKFGQPADEIDSGTERRGGRVMSPIAARSVRLSDRAWLAIITSPAPRPRHELRSYKRGHVIESSPEMFASDLQRQAELQPGRFADLACRVPPDALPVYWNALLHPLALLQPPQQAPSDWQPATDEQCCEVLRRVGFPHNPDVAMAYARCIGARHECPWPDDIVGVACRIASEHPNPQADRAAIGGDADERLDGEAISTARGCAAQALATVVFGRQAISPQLRNAIECLVADPVPGVRVAAIAAVTPALSFDRDQAVAWFLRACDGTLDQVMASHNADCFLSYTISTHSHLFHALLDRMGQSSRQLVAEAGAQWTTLVWLFDGSREDSFLECVNGSLAHRKGAADVLARHAADERVAAKCLAWLPRFLDDSERDVRAPATGFLRTAPDITAANAIALLRAFVVSKAFLAEPHFLVWELQRHHGDLRPLAQVIFDACERLTDETFQEGRVDRRDALGDLAVFLLRLYAQLEPPNDDPGLRKECLDRWDGILRHSNHIPAQAALFLE